MSLPSCRKCYGTIPVGVLAVDCTPLGAEHPCQNIPWKLCFACSIILAVTVLLIEHTVLLSRRTGWLMSKEVVLFRVQSC